ncbi:MAG: hypothetical protein NTU95_09545 [Methanothrix sp.]|nr:hypothetical protein [Methanothrix sp.]
MNGKIVQPGIWYYGLAVLIIIIGFVAFAGSIEHAQYRVDIDLN